jgi:hypothetical protein
MMDKVTRFINVHISTPFRTRFIFCYVRMMEFAQLQRSLFKKLLAIWTFIQCIALVSLNAICILITV